MEEAHGTPGGATREVRAGCRQRVEDWGHTPLLVSVDGVLWGSWAKARLVNSNQKSEILISHRVLSKGYIMGRSRGAGSQLITRAIGEVTGGIYICW